MGIASPTTYNDRQAIHYSNSVNAETDGSGKTIYVENKTYIGSGVLNGHSGNGQTDKHLFIL